MKKYIFLGFMCIMAIVLCGNASAASQTANFSANTTSCVTGEPIQFTDQSTGDPTSWAWDFNNDGKIDSTSQNPTYTYSTNGTYDVKLIVKNFNGIDSIEKTNYIHVGPDLITSMQVPSNPKVDENYAINYTVTNIGQGNTGSFTAWMYIDGKDVNKQVIDSLASGASETFTFNWTPTTTGTHTFSARADVYAQVTETNETNDATIQEINAQPVKPDLTTSINLPSHPKVGETSSVSYTITNNGSDAGPFTAWIYCNGKLLSKQTIDSLAAGENKTFTIDWTPTTSGTYTFSARADVYATVIESNEKNNAATQEVVVEDNPDLVTSIQAPENPQSSQTYTVSYTITNIGGDSGPFTAWIYCNGKLLSKQTIDSLAAGENKTFTFNWTPTTTGTYIFSARADVYSTVTESNEKNNAATQEVIVIQ